MLEQLEKIVGDLNVTLGQINTTLGELRDIMKEQTSSFKSARNPMAGAEQMISKLLNILPPQYRNAVEHKENKGEKNGQ